MSLTSVSNIKTNCGITSSANDTMLSDLLTQIEAMADQYCDRTLSYNATTMTEYYDGGGVSVLQLNNYPIVAITSIHDDLDHEYGADTLISSADYILNSKNGQILLEGLLFGNGVLNVKVVYTAGYGSSPATSAPSDLVLAIERLVFAEYIERIAGVNTTVEQDFFYKPDKLRREAYKILDRYKRVR